MKKVKILIVLFAITFQVIAQEIKDVKEEKKEEISTSKFYIGLASGINNPVGMFGLNIDVPIVDKMAIRAGAGLSTWGYRTNIGIRYEDRLHKGWGFGWSLSHSGGVKDFKMEMDVRRVSSKGVVTNKKEEVLVDFKAVNTVNVVFSYNWIFKKNNRFHLDFGYALRVTPEYFKIQNDSITLSDESKNALKVMAPGGVILGLGVVFGL